MTDNELMLFDRLEVIRAANKKYDLEHNAYISFSGGKDSTVLHYLMDEALPGNNIPRVFSNTGIEYLAIVDFVKQMAANDPRITTIYPAKKIKEMLEEKGYPFKSKEHAKRVKQYQNSHIITEYLKEYLENKGTHFTCPAILHYQFTEECKLKISHLCCQELKKKPFHKWEKENGRAIAITGMVKKEGGARAQVQCVITDKEGNLTHFHPLAPVTEEWEKWYIQEKGIKLCKLYYPPYNFRRTGCKGCPFALDLQSQLDTMAMYFPAEKRQCEYIWKPVYEEYRRLGYRLRKDDGQMTIWEDL